MQPFSFLPNLRSITYFPLIYMNFLTSYSAQFLRKECAEDSYLNIDYQRIDEQKNISIKSAQFTFMLQ